MFCITLPLKTILTFVIQECVCNATPDPPAARHPLLQCPLNSAHCEGEGRKRERRGSYQRVERVLITRGRRGLSGCTGPLGSTCRGRKKKKEKETVRSYRMWDFLVSTQSQEMAERHFRPLPNRGQCSFPLPCNSGYTPRGLFSSQVQMHHFL